MSKKVIIYIIIAAILVGIVAYFFISKKNKEEKKEQLPSKQSLELIPKTVKSLPIDNKSLLDIIKQSNSTKGGSYLTANKL